VVAALASQATFTESQVLLQQGDNGWLLSHTWPPEPVSMHLGRVGLAWWVQ
jgi:hypothetical protein